MPHVPALLARLRDEPRYLSSLATLLINELLAAPARRFVDPTRWTPAIVAGLQALAAAPDHTDWLERRLAAALTRLRPRQAAVRARLPPELVPLLQTIARRPFTPSRAIVRAIVDQATIRDLSRTILHSTLIEFTRKVGSIFPDTSRLPGAGMTSRLFGVARGVASAVGLEATVEDRVRSFVDGAVGRVIDMIVDRVSDPRHAAEGAAFRGDVLATVLALPEATLHAELMKLEPAVVAADIQAALVALAGWDQLGAEVEAALVELGEGLGEATVGELLAGSGLVEAWRTTAEAELRHHLEHALLGPGFAAWLEHLHAGTLPDEGVPSDM